MSKLADELGRGSRMLRGAFDAAAGFDRLHAWASLDPSRRSFTVKRNRLGVWAVSVWSSRWRVPGRRGGYHEAMALSEAVDHAIKASTDRGQR